MAVKFWPRYTGTKGAVTRAGKTLASTGAPQVERVAAREVANEWRRAHQRPMQTLLMSLRRHAPAVDPKAQVFQRSKRMKSIVAKLEDGRVRDLAAMQDLGGCRAIVTGVPEVDAVVDRLLSSRHEHTLVTNTDYMRSPRQSGYRSRHLVYAYKSRADPSWNGLRVELQIRTRAQHAWATAVEIMGTFSGEDLKAGKGNRDVLEFFQLMSDAIGASEDLPTIDGAPFDPATTATRLRELELSVQMRRRLATYQVVTQFHSRNAVAYQFLVLALRFTDERAPELLIYPYESEAQATERFEQLEASAAGGRDDVVLVRAGSLDDLRRAYPNYFADSVEFLSYVDAVLEPAVQEPV